MEDDIVSKALKAKKQLGEAFPLYQDMVHPAAREVGKTLEVIFATVNKLMRPYARMVFGGERYVQWAGLEVAEKLERRGIPPERLITPDPSVAGPALDAMRFALHQEELRDLYISLLAQSIDKETAHHGHPAFVDVIRQMTPDEAKLLHYIRAHGGGAPVIDLFQTKGSDRKFIVNNISLLGIQAECDYPDLAPSYIDNLIRLRLLKEPSNMKIADPKVYTDLTESEVLKKAKQEANLAEGFVFGTDQKAVSMTEYGKQFCNACGIGFFWFTVTIGPPPDPDRDQE